MGRLFGTDGVRGLANRDLTADLALDLSVSAAQVLGGPRLDGCVVYASGQPCPMCLSAMYLTGVSAVRFAYSNEDGEPFGLSTATVYAELAKLHFGTAVALCFILAMILLIAALVSFIFEVRMSLRAFRIRPELLKDLL